MFAAGRVAGPGLRITIHSAADSNIAGRPGGVTDSDDDLFSTAKINARFGAEHKGVNDGPAIVAAGLRFRTGRM